jgi:hypothetical protein
VGVRVLLGPPLTVSVGECVCFGVVDAVDERESRLIECPSVSDSEGDMVVVTDASADALDEPLTESESDREASSSDTETDSVKVSVAKRVEVRDGVADDVRMISNVRLWVVVDDMVCEGTVTVSRAVRDAVTVGSIVKEVDGAVVRDGDEERSSESVAEWVGDWRTCVMVTETC